MRRVDALSQRWKVPFRSILRWIAPRNGCVPRKRSVPGGASGLQIREGPRGGLWWVRLPFSSASITEWRDKDSYLGIADSSSCEGISAACFR
jgi:hypothetical protein